jgi:hypothetical protein
MSAFDIPEELRSTLEPYSKAAIEYGLFTPHELVSAINFFESDFADLFWIIQNSKEKIDVVSLLRSAKQEYDYRFYVEMPKHDQILAKHYHSKLILFIEDCIRDLPRNVKERKIDLMEIFEEATDKDYVLKKLVENNFVAANTYQWKPTDRGSKQLLAALFFKLFDSGFLKVRRTSYDLFAKITADVFKCKLNRKTIMDARDRSDLFNDYYFIKPKDKKK